MNWSDGMKDYADLIIEIIVFAVPMIGLYFSSKARIESAEKRMTTLEIELKHTTEKVMNNIIRLNDHEAQQRLLVSLTEQVKNLNSEMSELKADIKTLLRK